MKDNMLTQARLKELFSYNPKTGNFTVIKTRKGSSKKIGDVLGSKNYAGYLEAEIDAKKYYLHRLAYLYMTGEFPQGHIDHRNRNKTDNSWKNLKVVTHQENMQNNTNPRKHGTLGYRGVYKRKDKFGAKIVHNKKQIHLGFFNTVQEAANAYAKAKPLIHTNFYEG
jgi:hypothetical protein